MPVGIMYLLLPFIMEFYCNALCIWCKYLVCTVFTAVSEAHSGEYCAVITPTSGVQHTLCNATEVE